MLDRKTRKAIKAVINKYVGKHTGKQIAAMAMGVGIGFGALVDLVFTGGITTTVLLASGGIAGSLASGSALMLYQSKTETNKAHQNIKYNTTFVQIALETMQEQVDKAFNAAAADKATAADKQAFFAKAQEVTMDARTLSPVFNILSGKPQDHYEFSVPDGRTLTKAFESMARTPRKKTKKPAKKEEPQIADLKRFQEQMDKLDRIARKDSPNSDGPTL